MADQIDLFGEPPARQPKTTAVAPDAVVTCVFGRPWPVDSTWNGPNHCEQCNAQAEQLQAQFAAEVEAGKYNERGYTKNEWKAAGRPPDEWKKP